MLTVGVDIAKATLAELAFALWARQQASWQVHRPTPARVRAWARSQGLGPQPGPPRENGSAGCAAARALRCERPAGIARLAATGQ